MATEMLSLDGQLVVNNYVPESGAHSHLMVDDGGYTFEKICRDHECPVWVEFDEEEATQRGIEEHERALADQDVPLFEMDQEF